MKNTDIMEALGDVPEDLVMNALSSADALTAFPAEREQITMTENRETKSSRIRWLRGGIAAAAVIVLIAGNIALLYSLGKIGRGGSSQTPLTSDTTVLTETTEQTTETTKETTLTHETTEITTETEWTDTEEEQYTETTAVHYEFDKDGKIVPMKDDDRKWDPAFDIPAHILTDGKYQFQTRGNSLYRIDNDQLIVTVDNPQQYLDEADKNCQYAVEFDSIQAVGTDWYLISSWVNYFSDHWGWDAIGGPNFWYNRKTGKSEPATYTLKRSDLNIKPEWDKMYGGNLLGETSGDSVTWPVEGEIAPDGSGVYTCDFNTFIVFIPTPGNGKLRIYETGTEIQNYWGVNDVFPLENGKVLFSVICTGKDDPYPIGDQCGLFELDPTNGGIRPVRTGVQIFGMCRSGEKIYCLVYGIDGEYKTDEGVTEFLYSSELAEFLPESKSFRTVFDMENNISWIIGYYAISGDNVILYPWGDAGWECDPDVLVSLKDGKMKILKP